MAHGIAISSNDAPISFAVKVGHISNQSTISRKRCIVVMPMDNCTATTAPIRAVIPAV